MRGEPFILPHAKFAKSAKLLRLRRDHERIRNQCHSSLRIGTIQFLRKLEFVPKKIFSDLDNAPSDSNLYTSLFNVQTKSATWKIQYLYACHKKNGGVFPVFRWTFTPAHGAVLLKERTYYLISRFRMQVGVLLRLRRDHEKVVGINSPFSKFQLSGML